MVGDLKRMLSFAKENGWIAENPFPRGKRLYPRVRFKTNRLMTLDEDERLQAACGDDLELRTSFLYMADTGIAYRSVLELLWSEVDFDHGNITAASGIVEMTPRLASALRGLWESAGGSSEGRVFSRTSDHLYQAWYRVRDVAGVRGLTPTDIRRTYVWRMYQAGKRIEHIATALGYGLDTAHAYLDVDPEAAESERNSVRFQQFMHQQFVTPMQPQNGNEHGNGEAPHTPQLSDVKNLITEITPRIEAAKKLAKESLSKDWRAAVGKEFSELVPSVVEMLLSEKPTVCAREQVAHQHFDCSGSTLKRRLRAQHAAAASA
jgi:hypothetical protein